MKIRQQNYKHTGYAILLGNDKNKKIVPLFGVNRIKESQGLSDLYGSPLIGLYSVKMLMPQITQAIKDFEKNNGSLPLPQTQVLRTGFNQYHGIKHLFK